MQIRSLQDANTLRQTIIKVDKQISRRRRAIRQNLVPNAGIARDQVEAMVRVNNHRKAVLRMNQNEIRAMRRKERRLPPFAIHSSPPTAHAIRATSQNRL